MDKRCSRCMEVFPSNHWASSRSTCPACGGQLEPFQRQESDALVYEHYDSSTDIKFDMDELLSPDERRETWLLLWIGVGLVLAAFGLRIGFVILGGFEGFWVVPWWFDAMVFTMLLLALVMIVWTVRRLVHHKNLLRNPHKKGSQ